MKMLVLGLELSQISYTILDKLLFLVDEKITSLQCK